MTSENDQINAVNTQSELDVNIYKEFWVSWCDGTIRVGRGTVYNRDVIMTYTDPCPFKVMDIGVTGGAMLDWKFTEISNSVTNTIHHCDDKCHRFARRFNCPVFKPLTAFPTSRRECYEACATNQDCEALEYDKFTNTCNLMLGEIYQQNTTTSVIRRIG